jgi:hypothetical protein
MVVQELRNPTSTLPPHLFDPSALYRAATPKTGNQIVQQVFLTILFGIDFHFDYEESSTDKDTIGWEKVTKALVVFKSDFEQRCHENFVSPNKSNKVAFKSPQVTATADMKNETWTKDQLRTAKYALGNMMGTITYMYGDRQYMTFTYIDSEPPNHRTLIVPDKADHAQGYLWDDGFHQQLVRRWDIDRTLEILSSWWNQSDSQG